MPAMDPRTALLIASLLSLLNGGVLGLMHRSLMPEVRRSADDWRIGTLLFAGGGILMAMQSAADEVLVLSAAYATVFVGATLYWRSMRRFCGLPDSLWLFLPSALGICAVIVLVTVLPSHVLRGEVVSAVLAVLLLAGARTLQTATRPDIVTSRRVMIALLYLIGTLMLARAVYFLAALWLPEASRWSAWVDTATAVAIPVLPVIGTTTFLLMCAERGRRALQRAADTDELTGLPNRRAILRAAEARFAQAQGGPCDFGIAVIDVDFFKQINDRYGHAFGDAALRHVADVLAGACAAPHLLGRQGGEEFVAVLRAGEEADAVAIAEALRQTVDAATFRADGVALSISASIGVSVMADVDRDYDDVVRRADAALYTAKARGRNRVETGRP
jgi:diguanylate cyclase (GGDEF)-like protein